MSMPSSSDEVATRQGSCPPFSISSITRRSSWASEPWWARAISMYPSSPGALLGTPVPACSVAGSSCSGTWFASSFRRFARRSAPRRLLTKRIVEVCACTSSSSFGYIAGQIEFWVGAASKLASAGSPSFAGAGREASGSVMSSTGTTISRSSFLRMPALTTVHSRLGPTRKLAIRSSGRCVAERPMRWTVASGPRPSSWVRTRWSSRSRVRARCAPRLVGGDGVDLVDDHRLDVREDLVRPRGHHQIERLGRRDQDVRRLAEHRLAVLLRRVAGSEADLDRRADALERRAQVAIDVVARAP